VTDRVGSNEVSIKYCPTSDMLADFFTKPLQGAIFRKFRDVILNVADSPSQASQNHRSVLENKNEQDLAPRQ
jgi:hypothetical protein